MRKNRELSNEQWTQIKNVFPKYRTGRPPKDHKIMFEAILWVARTGAPWRDVPEYYGSFETVYSRFKKWQRSGLLEQLFIELSKEFDDENLSIDSTSIKAHQHSAGAKKRALGSDVNQHIGLSRGGKTTKIHVVIDGLGNPICFQLTSGNVYDGSCAINILNGIDLEGSNLLTDKAYNSSEIREFIESQGGSYTIPPKTNTKDKWPVDWIVYKERHLVECFFCKIKQFRRIATRYEKLAESFLGFVYLAGIFIPDYSSKFSETTF